MKPNTTPEERQKMIDMFNSLDPEIPDPYAYIGRKFDRSTSTVFLIIKKAKGKTKTNSEKPKIKYFNPKTPQF